MSLPKRWDVEDWDAKASGRGFPEASEVSLDRLRPPRKELSSEHLQSVEGFVAWLQENDRDFESLHLRPETKRGNFILIDSEIMQRKSTARKVFEGVYTVGGMAGGTGVTWNVFGRLVLKEKLGWFLGGYAVYDSSVSVGQWALMIGLNIHTYLSLYIFNGGQMLDDAHELSSNIKFNRPYQWPKLEEEASCLRKTSYYAYHFFPRISHSLAETFIRPTMPYTPHWSQNIVMPLAWAYWMLNTIPEMSAVIPYLVQTGNWWTGTGVSGAIFQRIGEQRRSTLHSLMNYFSYMALRGTDKETNSKRQELVSSLERGILRMREYGVTSGTQRDGIEVLHDLIFRKVQKKAKPKASFEGDIGDVELAVVPRSADRVQVSVINPLSAAGISKGPRLPGATALPSEGMFLTDEGIMAAMYAFGGSGAREENLEYAEPYSRKAVKGLGMLVGVAGSVTAGIITDLAVKGALTYVGVSPEVSEVAAKFVAVPLGLVRGYTSSLTNMDYFTRMYDAITGHQYYKDSGRVNLNGTDIVYGQMEGPVLAVNYLEGMWWEGLFYMAIGLPALEIIGLDVGESISLLVPTMISQAAFGAKEQADDIQVSSHALQKLRVTKYWKGLLDKLFVCCRGRYRCTPQEHFTGKDRKALKRSIHAYKLFRAYKKEREAMRIAPEVVVHDKFRVFLEENPLVEAPLEEKVAPPRGHGVSEEEKETKSSPGVERTVAMAEGRFPGYRDHGFAGKPKEDFSAGLRWRKRSGTPLAASKMEIERKAHMDEAEVTSICSVWDIFSRMCCRRGRRS